MNILVTGADRGLGFGITKQLLERGETVYAGRYLTDWDELTTLAAQYPKTLTILPLDVGSDDSVRNAASILAEKAGHLDVLISNAGITGRFEYDNDKNRFTDTQMMLNVYNVNSIGAVRLVEHLLPLIQKSPEKKLCFVSSEAGSITQTKRDGFFWYCMSKSALNMYVKILHNRIRKDGFKFRLYHPGWVRSYMSGKLNERGELDIDVAASFAVRYFLDSQVDEDSLVMRDEKGAVYQF